MGGKSQVVIKRMGEGRYSGGGVLGDWGMEGGEREQGGGREGIQGSLHDRGMLRRGRTGRLGDDRGIGGWGGQVFKVRFWGVRGMGGEKGEQDGGER